MNSKKLPHSLSYCILKNFINVSCSLDGSLNVTLIKCIYLQEIIGATIPGLGS